MANQSFPTASRLKTLKRFQIDVQLNDPSNLVSADAIGLAISNTLSAAGFSSLPIEDHADARLRCFVGIIPTLSDIHSRPVACAYALNLSAMTTVDGCPSSELFIVYNDMSFGTVDAPSLFKHVLRAATNLALSLTKSLSQ